MPASYSTSNRGGREGGGQLHWDVCFNVLSSLFLCTACVCFPWIGSVAERATSLAVHMFLQYKQEKKVEKNEGKTQLGRAN